MTDKRKDFKNWYKKLHELKDDIVILNGDNENGEGAQNDLEKLELHHIIPFENVKKNVDIKIIDSLSNLICLKKKLHDEISKEIANKVPYFGIEFDKDCEGVYYVSFFDIREYESSSKSYFQYNNMTKFRNGDLVFFNPELVNYIEKYNKTCLEINKNQLLGIWKKEEMEEEQISLE